MDVWDIIRIAAIILLVVVPVLAKLFRRAEPARPAGGRPAGGFVELEDDDEEEGEEAVLNEEIERFLREATGGQRKPPPAPAPEPIVAEIVPPRRLSDSGSRHLETSVDADEQRFGQHTSHLGEEVGQADDEMEDHIHAAFDHRLGGLSDTSVGVDVPDADVHDADVHDQTPGSSEDKTPSLAAELAAAFRDPQSIRQSIILSEILPRPEHRWSAS
ncbi:MAG: hypothetical protein IID44_08855 [Planctomycetes bacterium]|nr:hypothetical protein [Planctomycetota bacterium]